MEVLRTGHTAILVENVQKAAEFYSKEFGFNIAIVEEDWGIVRKNGDDIAFIKKGVSQHPPHFGLRVDSNESVDSLFNSLSAKVKLLKNPKLHRDNSYSFYFEDPDQNIVEVIFDPNNP